MISAGLNAAYYSDPTWGNHGLIFKNAGFKDVKKYRYYDSKKNSLDIEGFLADLESAPARYLNKTKKGRIQCVSPIHYVHYYLLNKVCDHPSCMRTQSNWS